jgi:phosphonopyruvate decarboxylase
MIEAEHLLSFLQKKKINYFYGVPDSVLKEFINIIPEKNHIITANEGGAVSLAIGQYLSTGNMSLVYMQNSGLSNAINPLISIAHKKVYSIPLIMMIGWRGAPGLDDEPQHILAGSITTKILKLLEIKFFIIQNRQDFKKINLLIKYATLKRQPVAFLIKNKTFFEKTKTSLVIKNKNNLLRSFVINELLKNIKKKSRIVSTTGFTSRELFQIRNKGNYKFSKDFYMIGGMGHSSMISLGYSLTTNKQIICLDGDGSLIMHLGSLISTGLKGKSNFKHILLNNGSHESVGGQKIDTLKVNFKEISKSFGYKKYYFASNNSSFTNQLGPFLKSKGPSFFEIYIRSETIKNLSRPKNFLKIKEEFIK